MRPEATSVCGLNACFCAAVPWLVLLPTGVLFFFVWEICPNALTRERLSCVSVCVFCVCACACVRVCAGGLSTPVRTQGGGLAGNLL